MLNKMSWPSVPLISSANTSEVTGIDVTIVTARIPVMSADIIALIILMTTREEYHKKLVI